MESNYRLRRNPSCEQPKATIALLSFVVAFAVQLNHSNNNAKRRLQAAALIGIIGRSGFMTQHAGWLA